MLPAQPPKNSCWAVTLQLRPGPSGRSLVGSHLIVGQRAHDGYPRLNHVCCRSEWRCLLEAMTQALIKRQVTALLHTAEETIDLGNRH